MKTFFLYRKWNILVLLNNLVLTGFYIYSKKIIHLKFDISNFFFWVYSKKIRFQNKKIVDLKRRFNWN